MRTTTTGPVGRREANKARTRNAVVEAAMRLRQCADPDTLTAEKVADEAGISRRTFFNYFPSVEAVYAFQAQQLLDDLRAALAARPLREPLIDGAKAVVADIFGVPTLANAVQTWRLVEACPAANRYVLEANSESLIALAEDWAKDRLTPTEPQTARLRVAVLTAACMGAFDVARRDWLARHSGPVHTSARDDFVRTVDAAFEMLRPAVEHG